MGNEISFRDRISSSISCHPLCLERDIDRRKDLHGVKVNSSQFIQMVKGLETTHLGNQ